MPRGGFTAALLEGGLDVKPENVPLDAKERLELEWLRNRVAALEAQLRKHGIEPLAAAGLEPEEVPEPSMDPEVARLLSDSGLGRYASTFASHGFCDLYSVRGMQEAHMRNLGILPGDALKLRLKIQEREPAPDVAPDAHQPGVYRCVHSPRVAIRAAPSRNSKTLETLRTGDLIRISEIVPPCWGKIDESELWARLTTSWPRKPKTLRPLGDGGELLDDGEGEEEELVQVPEHAFVLIEGAEAGIDGPLLRCLHPDEAEKALWPFREALEIQCEEFNSASERGKPALRVALRQKVVETAKRYVGRPFAKCYHDPDDGRCLPGSDLLSFESTSFVNNVQLICHVVHVLRADFGFVLDFHCKPVHIFDLLRSDELATAGQLEPGDLIFYETRDRITGRPRAVHVELFAGGSASVGSLPWSASPRTGGKDGVQLFENYDMDELEGHPITSLRFCSIRSWLDSNMCSFARGQFVRQQGPSATI